jgi:dTDP-4-dehydrorhamnose reductase
MLGRELVRRLAEDEAISSDRLIGWTSADLDITDRAGVLKALEALRPGSVLNAAAYTDVDGCESHMERAHSVNGSGPGYIAEGCRIVNATLVHVSTDFVFDGKADRPYRPEDPCQPLSVYGRSKRQGELAVVQSGADHMIVRTSWLFGMGGRNFVDTILARGRAGQPLRVVTDQVGRPTYTCDLAEAVIHLLDVGARGTVHVANTDECSWFGFAAEILRQEGISVSLEPITSDRLDRPARRPSYSVLDTTWYTSKTGHTTPSWPDALRRYREQRAATETARISVQKECR